MRPALLSVMVLVLLASPVARAGCPVSVAELGAQVQAVVEASDAEWEAAVGALDAAVGCVDGVLGSAEVGALHRSLALRAYVDRDLSRVREHLAAAHAADPDTPLPAAVAPVGHLLQRLRVEAAAVAPQSRPADLPAGRVLRVDGHVSTVRPAARVSFMQVTNASGGLLAGGLVGPDGDLPARSTGGAAAADALPAPTEVPPASGRSSRPWWWAAAGLGGSAAVLATSALVGRASIRSLVSAPSFDPATDGALLERRQSTTNGLGYAAQGAGVAALGCGAVAWVVQW